MTDTALPTRRPAERGPRGARRRPGRGGQGRRRPGRRRLRPAGGAALPRARADGGRARASPRRCWCAAWRPRSTWTRRRVQFTPDLMPGDITGSMVIEGGGAARAHVPRGPGLHQPAARRRDQPDPAQDAVGAARGDGGGPGLRRRPHPHAAPAVPGGGHAEPGRVRGHLPAARGPARPVPAQGAPCRCPSATTSSRSCGGTPTASTRATSRAAGVGQGGRARRTSRPASRRCGQVRVSDEVAGYIVDIARATRQAPSLSLGVSPRGADGPAALGARVGVAQRPRLRHPRRREGAGPRARWRTGWRCGPEAELEGVDVGQVLATALGVGAGPALMLRSRGGSPCWCCSASARCCCARRTSTVWAWLLLVRCSWSPLDVLLAPSRTALSVVRRPVGRARQGEPTSTTLEAHRHRPSDGPRRAARRLAAVGRRERTTGTGSTSPRAARTALTTGLRPTRRGDLQADRVTVRTLGPLGLAGRQGAIEVPGTLRVLPAFPSHPAPAQPARPAARARRPGGGAGARPGHRVRLAARVRQRRRRPQRRLAGQRAHPLGRGAHLAARARPPRRAGPGHRAHLGRPGRRRAPARLGDGRRPAARHSGLAGR